MKNLFLTIVTLLTISFGVSSCSKDDVINNTKLYKIEVDSTKLICSCPSDTTIPPSIDVDGDAYIMINQNSFIHGIGGGGDTLTFDINLSQIFNNGTGSMFYSGSNFTGPKRKLDYVVNGNINSGKIYLYFHNFNGSNPKKVWGSYSEI